MRVLGSPRQRLLALQLPLRGKVSRGDQALRRQPGGRRRHIVGRQQTAYAPTTAVPGRGVRCCAVSLAAVGVFFAVCGVLSWVAYLVFLFVMVKLFGPDVLRLIPGAVKVYRSAGALAWVE